MFCYLMFKKYLSYIIRLPSTLSTYEERVVVSESVLIFAFFRYTFGCSFSTRSFASLGLAYRMRLLEIWNNGIGARSYWRYGFSFADSKGTATERERYAFFFIPFLKELSPFGWKIRMFVKSYPQTNLPVLQANWLAYAHFLVKVCKNRNHSDGIEKKTTM